MRQLKPLLIMWTCCQMARIGGEIKEYDIADIAARGNCSPLSGSARAHDRRTCECLTLFWASYADEWRCPASERGPADDGWNAVTHWMPLPEPPKAVEAGPGIPEWALDACSDETKHLLARQAGIERAVPAAAGAE
jgi:hypothetical protein